MAVGLPVNISTLIYMLRRYRHAKSFLLLLHINLNISDILVGPPRAAVSSLASCAAGAGNLRAGPDWLADYPGMARRGRSVQADEIHRRVRARYRVRFFTETIRPNIRHP